MTYTIHDKGLSTMIGWKTEIPMENPSRLEIEHNFIDSGNGNDVSELVMQRNGTLRSHYQNLIVWHLVWVYQELCGKLQQWCIEKQY
jgi:hypothetical protein